MCLKPTPAASPQVEILDPDGVLEEALAVIKRAEEKQGD